LYPVNQEAIPKSKLLPSTTLAPSASFQPERTSGASSQVESPHKAMRSAILATVCPAPSQSTRDAIANTNRQRKRVQKRYGEVLTLNTSLERLRNEEAERVAKKSKKSNSSARRRIDQSICYVCMNANSPIDEDMSDVDDEEVDWVGCNRCDRWYHIVCITNKSDPCVHCFTR